MTYTSSARQPDSEPRPTWSRGAERPPGGPESSAVNGAANDSNVVPITAAHTARQGCSKGRARRAERGERKADGRSQGSRVVPAPPVVDPTGARSPGRDRRARGNYRAARSLTPSGPSPREPHRPAPSPGGRDFRCTPPGAIAAVRPERALAYLCGKDVVLVCRRPARLYRKPACLQVTRAVRLLNRRRWWRSRRAPCPPW
ncbi:hypothetical protein C1I97_15190 [Streptomyces sp. NTH33]|nr:hypothetical protein C1I97_15190 [Streptomyces sp. NTH33]